MIGRKKEVALLQNAAEAPSATCIALYGRHRSGKTFLIRESFKATTPHFFEITGLANGGLVKQLETFSEALAQTFYHGSKTARPKNWQDAFRELTLAINMTAQTHRIVLFLDELPWLATAKSGFLAALRYFWQSHWQRRKNLILIVAGSDVSWMLDKLINANEFSNSITHKIHLKPLSLQETELYLQQQGLRLNQKQLLQLHSVTGGIPYYLQKLKKELSVAQNINALCFHPQALLLNEFEIVFNALFGADETYLAIIRAIAKIPKGISREELIAALGTIKDGGTFNKKLKQLEEAGFIYCSLPVNHARRGMHYRIYDEYILFYLSWIEPFRQFSHHSRTSKRHWEFITKKPGWQAWASYAFETLCFKNINAIKKILKIDAESIACSDWCYNPVIKKEKSKVHIDLVFDCADKVILGDIKFSKKPFLVTKEYLKELTQKEKSYQKHTRTKKPLHWTLISTQNSAGHEELVKTIPYHITLKDLFAKLAST